MKHNIQILLAVVLIVLLILLTNPFMFYMPSATGMLVLLAATVLGVVWATFVIAEQAGDEREEQHRTYSGRVAYIAGVLMLTFALLSQGLVHHIDPWIGAALAVMVVAKLASRLYADHWK
ncbi:MAG: hypothetical protein AAB472_00980 [Patescibacteria group bacterium]